MSLKLSQLVEYMEATIVEQDEKTVTFHLPISDDHNKRMTLVVKSDVLLDGMVSVTRPLNIFILEDPTREIPTIWRRDMGEETISRMIKAIQRKRIRQMEEEQNAPPPQPEEPGEPDLELTRSHLASAVECYAYAMKAARRTADPLGFVSYVTNEVQKLFQQINEHANTESTKPNP